MGGFFDTFVDTSGGDWVGKDEKDDLIDAGTTFTITSVRREDSQYGERYVATVTLGDADRLISFPYGTVDSRDRMLGELTKWLEDPANPAPVVFLERNRRAILIRPAL